MYGASRWSYRDWLVNLDRPRVILESSLFVALLALQYISVPLFSFPLHDVFLLCSVLVGVRLHHFAVSCFALTLFSFPVGIDLLLRGHVLLWRLLLLQCLRYAGKRVWGSLVRSRF